jgi:uncharacterized protein (TIGR02246 family)
VALKGVALRLQAATAAAAGPGAGTGSDSGGKDYTCLFNDRGPMIPKRLLALIVLAAAMSPGSVLSQTSDADTAAIRKLDREFSAAYERGDASAMTDMYTDDAVLFPEQSAAIKGREAIRQHWTLGPGQQITRHLITPTEITVDGRHAYDHGVFEISGVRDGKAWGPFRGKYVVVWRREKAGWRMVLDMWNSGPK